MTSSNADPSADVGATLAVIEEQMLPAPSVTTTFTPASVEIGGYSRLSITLINNDPDRDIVGARVLDLFPSGFVSAPNSVVVSNTCSQHVYPQASQLRIYDATVPAGGSCTVVVKVVGAAAGAWANPTGSVGSGNALTALGASAQLTVTSTALLPRPSIALSFSPDTVVVGETSDMKLTLVNNSQNPVEGIQSFYTYVPGVANAASGVVAGNTCGGTLDAPPNGNSISVSGATVPPADSCSITVRVVGRWPSGNTISSGLVYSANAGVAGPSSAMLLVESLPGLLASPSVVTAFAPSNVDVGDTSQLTITLNNTDSAPVTGVGFMDFYPEHLVNASASVVSSNSCGGTVTAGPSGNFIQLVNGMIPLNGCSLVINVTPTLPYTLTNHTGPVTSSNANTGADASATLHATYRQGGPLEAPGVSETFSPAAIPVGSTSQMKITLTNSNASAVAGVQFSDVYLQGVTNAPGGVLLSNSCGGTIAADASGAYVALSDGVIPPQGDCEVVVAVTGSTAGTYDIHTGVVTSANADFSADAVGTLVVTDIAPQAQVITFTSTAPLNAAVGESPYVATATATSGLPVALTIDGASSTVCTIDNGGVVSFIGAGNCTIDANQSGDATYAPAPQQQQTFAVNSAGGTTSQTIAFTSTAPANATVAGPTYHATATATSGCRSSSRSTVRRPPYARSIRVASFP